MHTFDDDGNAFESTTIDSPNDTGEKLSNRTRKNTTNSSFSDSSGRDSCPPSMMATTPGQMQRKASASAENSADRLDGGDVQAVLDHQAARSIRVSDDVHSSMVRRLGTLRTTPEATGGLNYYDIPAVSTNTDLSATSIPRSQELSFHDAMSLGTSNYSVNGAGSASDGYGGSGMGVGRDEFRQGGVLDPSSNLYASQPFNAGTIPHTDLSAASLTLFQQQQYMDMISLADPHAGVSSHGHGHHMLQYPSGMGAGMMPPFQDHASQMDQDPLTPAAHAGAAHNEDFQHEQITGPKRSRMTSTADFMMPHHFPHYESAGSTQMPPFQDSIQMMDQDLTTPAHASTTNEAEDSQHEKPTESKRPRMTTSTDLMQYSPSPFPGVAMPNHFPRYDSLPLPHFTHAGMMAREYSPMPREYSPALMLAAQQEEEWRVAEEILTRERLLSAQHQHQTQTHFLQNQQHLPFAQQMEMRGLSAAEPGSMQTLAQYEYATLQQQQQEHHADHSSISEMMAVHSAGARSSTTRPSNTEYFTMRNVKTLKTEGDSIWLSEFLCFLRSDCCEVFEATSQHVLERRKSKQIRLNQVGIRCRFCAHLPHVSRAGRSACYPSSVDRIYQSVTMMIREHFPICDEFPEEVRSRYVALKKRTQKGEMESKTHWKKAARELGMTDTEKGIYFKDRVAEEELERSVL